MIHDIAVHGVWDSHPQTNSVPKIHLKGFGENWTFGIYLTEAAKLKLLPEWRDEKLILTPEKREEIQERVDVVFSSESRETQKGIFQQYKDEYLATLNPLGGEGYQVESHFKLKDIQKIDRILNEFYKEAAIAQTEDEKLRAVVRCCRALIVFHTLPDGNGRTIRFALLSVLLYQVGFNPAVLNPHIFNGTRTISQMVEELKENIDTFEKMVLIADILELAKKFEILPYDSLMEVYGAGSNSMRAL